MANTKTTTITNLDGNPPIRPTAGKAGGSARLKVVSDQLAVPSGVAASDTFQLLRLPSNAKVKALYITTETLAATALTFDLDMDYSSSTLDFMSGDQGTGVAKAQMFGKALDLHAAVTRKDITFAGNNGGAAFDVGGQNKELWDAAGLASDPGGYFDIVAKAVTVTTVSAGGTLMLEVYYSEE